MLKFARLDDAFLEVFQPQVSPVEGQSLQQKEKKRRKKEGEKNPKIKKPKGVGHFLVQKLCQNFDFCACPSHNVVKRDAGGKKGKLLCCKRIFNQIKANLAEIHLKKPKNVQKNILQNVPGVNGLTTAGYGELCTVLTNRKWGNILNE